jgi:hypothetical protein
MLFLSFSSSGRVALLPQAGLVMHIPTRREMTSKQGKQAHGY